MRSIEEVQLSMLFAVVGFVLDLKTAQGKSAGFLPRLKTSLLTSAKHSPLPLNLPLFR